MKKHVKRSSSFLLFNKPAVCISLAKVSMHSRFCRKFMTMFLTSIRLVRERSIYSVLAVSASHTYCSTHWTKIHLTQKLIPILVGWFVIKHTTYWGMRAVHEIATEYIIILMALWSFNAVFVFCLLQLKQKNKASYIRLFNYTCRNNLLYFKKEKKKQHKCLSSGGLARAK